MLLGLFAVQALITVALTGDIPGNFVLFALGFLLLFVGHLLIAPEAIDCEHVVQLVAVDSSKPDLDEGEIGREHYGWIEEGFAGDADVRIFVCHHHLMPVPGTGRERNQVRDAGDVISLLRQLSVDIVLSGHRHVPYVWPVAGMFIVHSGTVSTMRTRGFPHPAYNLIRVEGGRIAVELCVPGGERQSLGEYPARLARGALGAPYRPVRAPAARRLARERLSST